MNSPRGLDGTVALVTGGARGIGLACAQALREKGAQVAICDLESAPVDGFDTWKLDVRDRAAFVQVVAEVHERLGPVELLINNAGIMPVGGVLDMPEETDRLQVDVNLHGVINGIHAVLPGMLNRGIGHIVNVASLAGRIPTPYSAVYSATKFGVVGLTESLRYEHHGSGVRFTTVLPGYVDTELIAGLRQPWWPRPVSPDAVAQALCAAIRTGRGRVYVPRIGGFLSLLPWILPHWLARLLGTSTGAVTLLKKVDEEVRKPYRTRALAPPISDSTDQ